MLGFGNKQNKTHLDIWILEEDELNEKKTQVVHGLTCDESYSVRLSSVIPLVILLAVRLQCHKLHCHPKKVIADSLFDTLFDGGSPDADADSDAAYVHEHEHD